MEKKRKTLAGRLTGRLFVWTFFIALGLSWLLLHFEGEATRQFYSEIYQNKMLITNEYTRRVISDVYVAVTNNIYYLEHSLDNPDSHKEILARIVKSGTRVRSCGINFIEDYYPQKGHHFSPFAWRNVTKPDEIYSEDMGDADLDYFKADWFIDIVKSDSAQWSDPFYDSYDNKTTLSAYMVPIHDQEGRVVAVLRADISLDWLTTKLNEADSTVNNNSMLMAGRFEMRSKSFIINHDGTYITHVDGKSILKDNLFSQLESSHGSDVEGLVKKMKEGVEGKDIDNRRFIVNGQQCYLFYTPIKYTKWVLVTIVPCRAIDTLSYLNGATIVFIILLALFIIVLVAYYCIKNGTEPVKRLVRITDDMANGKFDTPMPEMKYNDELSQLRDSIEEMQFLLSNYADEAKHSKNAEKHQ